MLYTARNKCKIPDLADFQLVINNYEKIEYIIAEKKSRLNSHLQKYEKLRVTLQNTDE